MKQIDLEEALQAFFQRPGILLGPRATCLPGTIEGLINSSMKAIGVTSVTPIEQLSYRDGMDVLARDLGDKYPVFRDEFIEQVRILKPSLDLPHLVKAGWSACISLTEDLLFESALRNHLDRLPTSLSVTIIDSPPQVPPERTIPIFKLFGNVNSLNAGGRAAFSRSETLVRQQAWPLILRSAPDYLRDAPLFVVGCETTSDELKVVLGILIGLPRPNVSKIIFLKNDPVLKDPTILALAGQLNSFIVDADLREVCAAIAELTPRKPTERTPKSSASLLLQAAENHGDIVVRVPADEKIDIDQAHLPALVDALFRPSAIDWQPFAAGLDLRRSVTESIVRVVGDALQNQSVGSLSFIVVRGEAGVGKTTLLKRVALELSSVGVTCLWCRRAGSGWLRSFRNLATNLTEAARKETSPSSLVVVCDDPWGLKMDAAELMGCFERFPGKVSFIFAWRNSDFFSTELMPLSIQGANSGDIEVPYTLDDEEWKGLARMMQRIGAVSSQAEAERELQRVPSRNSTDILCSLWYLVPETRSQLSDSLRDEYCRLGSVRESLNTLAQQVAINSESARKAYECVTVSSSLGFGVPIEVLVRTLGINYGEWIDMTVSGRPLWGLLYDEHDESGSTVLFRTRNEIVTKVLLDLVNGGVGHAGEFRVLSNLVRSCDGGSSIYRSFALDILVKNRQKLQKILTFEQGIELFDIARIALGHEDRLLEHHKGIWIDDVGRDSLEAYKQLDRALRTELHPSSDRDAPVEHIHTSMASALVKLMKAGHQDRELGFQQVKEHLRRASSSSFFNAHTAHVSANLLFEVASQAEDGEDKVALASISEAFQEIERALQLIGTHGRNHFRDEKSIAMLTDLQRRIVRSLPDTEARKNLALKLFAESGSQIGFEAVGRSLLAEATSDDKGSSYNLVQVYIDQCIQVISDAKAEPTIELIVLWVDLIVRWRIQRFLSVNWDAFLGRMRTVMESQRYRDDAMKKFYFAVALFHKGKITEGNAVFAGLRRQQTAAAPKDIRCYYMSEDGHPQRMQGTLERKHDYAYILIDDIQLSVPMRRMPSGKGSGQIVHTYIAFSLNGPTAVLEKPTDQSVRLP